MIRSGTLFWWVALARRATRASMAIACVLAPPLMLATTAHAQSWPARPVRLIVPITAGTLTDITARLIADRLRVTLGQQIVVDNRAGAGGIVGMNALVRSAPDGYTMGFVPASVLTLTPVLFRNPQFDADRDLVPVVAVVTTPFMVAVHPGSGIESFPDLVKRARAQPDKINIAVLARNTAVHLAGELLASASGIRLYVVPYKGATDAVASVVSGENAVTIGGVATMATLARAGKLRAIATTSRERLPGHENIPTVAETVPGFEVGGWFGIVAPMGTPAEAIERINRDVNAIIQVPEVAARLVEFGAFPSGGSPAALGEFIRAERPVWAKLARDLGIQPE